MIAYRHLYIPYKASQIRRKDKINVLFVIWSVSAWKSELLYKEMLKHPRFNPTLLIVKYWEEDDRENLRKYAMQKNYPYQELENPNANYTDTYKPDITIIQKPYGSEYYHNLKSLFCYVPYAFHGSKDPICAQTNYILNCWQVYYENDKLAKEYSSLLRRPIYNSYGTGIPAMDELSIEKEMLSDPWKDGNSKKRIIYAPHHSIDTQSWWHTSTFLETGEIILNLAKKYSDHVQWAFKPHPLLKGKLEQIWGKERTEKYYKEWSDSEWSQYESGKYLELFKYSDAMIHDCGSFMVEYHYTQNPVMYLGQNLEKNLTIQSLNSMQREALSLHTIGFSECEIEQFIIDVINGNDPGLKLRQEFYKNYLLSPNGEPAVRNIIECICGQQKFKRY